MRACGPGRGRHWRVRWRRWGAPAICHHLDRTPPRRPDAATPSGSPDAAVTPTDVAVEPDAAPAAASWRLVNTSHLLTARDLFHSDGQRITRVASGTMAELRAILGQFRQRRLGGRGGPHDASLHPRGVSRQAPIAVSVIAPLAVEQDGSTRDCGRDHDEEQDRNPRAMATSAAPCSEGFTGGHETKTVGNEQGRHSRHRRLGRGGHPGGSVRRSGRRCPHGRGGPDRGRPSWTSPTRSAPT